MKTFSYLLLASLIFNCASIVRGSKEELFVSTEPTDADITVTDGNNSQITSGKSPMVLKLDKGSGYFRGAKYIIKVEKPGYKPQFLNIESRISGWYVAGNIVIGGLIGWLIVDPISGAMWTLSPDKVNVAMQTDVEKNAQKDMKSLRIVLLEQVPDEVRKDMVPIQAK